MPERLRDNVLNMGTVQFPYIDVVNRFKTLPFRSNVLDAVIDQAIFEHLADPSRQPKRFIGSLGQEERY